MITQTRNLALVVIVILPLAGAFLWEGSRPDDSLASCQQDHPPAARAFPDPAPPLRDPDSTASTRNPAALTDSGGESAGDGSALGLESMTVEQRRARAALGHLNRFKSDAEKAGPRRAPGLWEAVLCQSLAAVQDEFGDYVEHASMPLVNSTGTALQFTLNNRGYYFSADTFPEFAELQRLKGSGALTADGLPENLHSRIVERYEEARGYLQRRAGL